MQELDITQSLLVGLSKIILTPILKNGGFSDFTSDFTRSHNLLTGIGAAVADYAAQIALEPLMFNNIGNISDVNIGQSVLTGALYTGGGWILKELGIYGGLSYKYVWPPMKYNYLTEFIYISLLDSAAQVATPHTSILSSIGMKNLKKNTFRSDAPAPTVVTPRGSNKSYIVPVQNGIPTQTAIQSVPLKKNHPTILK